MSRWDSLVPSLDTVPKIDPSCLKCHHWNWHWCTFSPFSDKRGHNWKEKKSPPPQPISVSDRTKLTIKNERDWQTKYIFHLEQQK